MSKLKDSIRKSILQKVYFRLINNRIISFKTVSSALFIGGIIKKLGIRPVVILGGVLLSAGFFLSVFAQRIEHLVVTIGLMVGELRVIMVIRTIKSKGKRQLSKSM